MDIPQKDILSLCEAAAFLGFTKNGLYGLTRRRQIPFSKPSGKKAFFSRRELEEWAMSNRPLKLNEY